MQVLRFVAATVASLALLSSVADASIAATKTTNLTMSVGDGTTVESKNSTVFLGTEYNPNKCVLQFASLKCTAKDCGELNGYALECVNVGKQNGKDKKLCQCKADEVDVCQNSTAPEFDGAVPQFGDCSNGKQCVDSYGHVPSSLELRICAEKMHCVKEVNTTASKPAEICHTCRSCIAQNDASDAQLSDVKRFDCTKICPQEILDSLAKRNKEGVGIADEVSSGSDESESTSGSEEASSGSVEGQSSASKAGSASKSSGAATQFNLPAVIGGLIVATLSLAIIN
jgi:hypothetical protein